jgi:hypothetical protein
MSKPVCVLQAPLWTRSGYGDWALTIAKSLLRYDKFDLNVVPTRWGACSKKNLEEEIQDPLGKALLDKVLKGPLQAQPELYIQVTIPNEFLLTPQGPMKIGKFNIGMTASIETTAPRAEWLEGLNRMDLNIAMAKHGKDVLALAKYSKKLPNGTVEPLVCKVPLEVLFWGADTKVYNKTSMIVDSLEEVMGGIKEDFAFLFVGQWTGGSMNADRKAIGWLIKTFLETFRGQKNPPCLIIKSSGATLSHMDRHECLQKIHEVSEMTKNAHPGVDIWPNVYLLHGELNDTEMNALYNHKKVKVHVSFTHGEGFGHPLLLSTLSGKPLFASNWSGHLDFLNPKYANLLEGTLENIPGEAVNEWFIREAQWFTVDYAKAGVRMKRAFDEYESLLPNAESLRAENAEKFSTEAMDKEFHALLDKYVPKFAMPSAIVLPKLKKLDLPKLKPSSKVPEPIKTA